MDNQGFEFFKRFIKTQFCYERSMLTFRERKAYDEICEGLLAFSDSIRVPGIFSTEIQSLYEKVRRDNPWLFYVASAMYRYAPHGMGVTVLPKYRFDREAVDATLYALANKCSAITAGLHNLSAWEKEKAIHDYLCRHVVYDYSFCASSSESVGPLLYGKGVCEGIAKAAKLLLDFVKIKSLLVNGRSTHQTALSTSVPTDLHAWNVVEINGAYYHLDVTFDITIMAFDVVRYDYFNLSDQEILLDHEILSVSVPHCRLSGGYYKTQKLLMQTQTDFQSYLTQALEAGKKDIVVQLPQGVDLQQAREKLMAIASKALTFRFRLFSRYELSYNDTQRVFHLHIS